MEQRISEMVFKKNNGTYVYVIDAAKGTALMVKMYWRSDDESEAFACVSILQEQSPGTLHTVAKTCIPCSLDENGRMIRVDGEFNRPVSYRGISARFTENEAGLPELTIKTS